MPNVATTSPAVLRLATVCGHLLKDCLDRADEEVEATGSSSLQLSHLGQLH